jgi:peroxiredoxin Q/BCP
MLEVGAKIPSVTVADDTGNPVKLKSYLGKPFVLWFYPRADTPG